MSPDVVIRPMRPDAADAAAVAPLCDELGYPSDQDAVLRRLERISSPPDHHVLVAEVDGRVVGLASLLRSFVINRDELSVRLQTLVVSSSARNRGIDAKLVAASEAWAHEQGAPTLHLTSGTHRSDAHRFYERLGCTNDGLRVVRVLEQVALKRGLPVAVVMDNGPEFISTVLDQWAHDNGVQLAHIEPGKPTQNAFIESFNASFRDECLNENWFTTLDDAHWRIAAWRDDYNSVRPHGALGRRATAEFARTWAGNQPSNQAGACS